MLPSQLFSNNANLATFQQYCYFRNILAKRFLATFQKLFRNFLAKCFFQQLFSQMFLLARCFSKILAKRFQQFFSNFQQNVSFSILQQQAPFQQFFSNFLAQCFSNSLAKRFLATFQQLLAKRLLISTFQHCH